MIPGVTSTMHHTGGTYLEWECAHCRGSHAVKVPDIEIQTHALEESVVTTFDGTIVSASAPEYEIRVRIPDRVNLHCPLPLDKHVYPPPAPEPTSMSSIIGTDLLRRIYLAIEYTVLDPDERAALVKALQKEVR